MKWSISENVTVVYPPFSAHKMCWIPCVVHVLHTKKPGGSHTAPLIMSTLKRCGGGLFPIKGLISSKHLLIVLLFRCLDQQYQAQRKTPIFSFCWGVPSLLLSSCLCTLFKNPCVSVCCCCCNVHLFCSCTSFDIVGLDYSPVFKLVFCINLGIYSRSTPIFRQKHFWHHV